MSFDEVFQKQLVDRYEKRSRAFSQLFTATVVFALGFLAFILIPLVGLQHDEARIRAELDANTTEQRTTQAELEQLTADRASALAKFGELTASRAELERRLTELEAQREDLAQRIEHTELAIDKRTQELNLLDEQRATFDRFHLAANSLPDLDVDRFVEELHEFLPQLFDGIEDLGIEAQCPDPDAEIRSDCLVHAKVMAMLSVHDRTVRESLLLPMRAVDEAAADELEARLQEALARFEGVLAERPDFWQEITQKHFVGEQFRDVISDLSHEIGGAIQAKIEHLDQLVRENGRAREELLAAGRALNAERDELQAGSDRIRDEVAAIEAEAEAAETKAVATEQEIADLRAGIEAAQQEVERLSARQATITTEKAAITERLENVQSPFGTLPIGLAEAIQAFPIIVAAGLIMSGLALSELIGLRRGYHVLLRDAYPGDRARIDQGISLVAPLFLDPVRPTTANAWRALVLAIPILVYVAAIFLIAESWSLAREAEAMSGMLETGYLGIYLAFGLLLLLPIVRLAREWRDYTRRSADAAANTESA